MTKTEIQGMYARCLALRATNLNRNQQELNQQNINILADELIRLHKKRKANTMWIIVQLVIITACLVSYFYGV